jgi:hypothetical protein
MKFGQMLASAVICGFVFSPAIPVQAQSSKQYQGYATVVHMEGKGRYTTGDNAWHPVVVGLTLGPGAVIQSAVDSKIDLVLGNKVTQHVVSNPDRVAPATDAEVRSMVSYNSMAQQNVIRMESDTVLAIDKLTISDTGVDAVTDTELDLRQGTIFGCVKKLSAESQYFVKTPNGIAGVRGTTFILSANGDISVIFGSCVISEVVDGQTITKLVGPGEQFNPVTGQVSRLTPEKLDEALRTAVFIMTLEEGIISFTVDRTVIFISPVQGSRTGPSHPAWPF